MTNWDELVAYHEARLWVEQATLDDVRKAMDAAVAYERQRCAQIAITAQARCDGMAKECAAAGRNDFGWVCRVIGAREIADEILHVELREKSSIAC